MTLSRLELVAWRSWAHLVVDLAPDGLTVLRGANGSGKTNLIEAIAWLATGTSFRGAPRDALVRSGERVAVVRGIVLELPSLGESHLIEATVDLDGRDRWYVDRERVRTRESLGRRLRIEVFTPETLATVKGPPARRRALLDGLAEALDPTYGDVRRALERILRQRQAILRAADGRLDDERRRTLQVFDERLAAVGEELAEVRARVVAEMAGPVADAYAEIAGDDERLLVSYRPSWEGALLSALAASRAEDLRRMQTNVGPHRDDLEITLGGRPARLHASQGEQRTIALAWCVASQRRRSRQDGSPPTLLLDDVLSELDDDHGRALLARVPAGQVLVTTTGGAGDRILEETAAAVFDVTADRRGETESRLSPAETRRHDPGRGPGRPDEGAVERGDGFEEVREEVSVAPGVRKRLAAGGLGG